MTLQPTAVYSPGTSPGPSPGGQQGRVYVIHQPQASSRNPVYRAMTAVPAGTTTANNMPGVSNQLPYWLRGSLNNRAIVFNMWIVAMIIVSFDEWHNLGILPRPSRLWNTSLVYGILVMAGFVDVMVPITNMLAIGFTITLLSQYFQGKITPTQQGA